ncbi:MAG: T9SS type A sorting domain-containing protein, partial [Flammeovirgaceae bacterium]|nr:T9SS type A sorting domain-containing protein [Flammeovirgaceae bacterium]
DFDGKTESWMVPVTFNGVFLNVYPNPFDGKSLRVKINGDENTKPINLLIYDQLGKECYQTTLELNDGYIEKEIVFNEPLEAGVYILKLGPSAFFTRKLNVVR